MKSWMKTVVLLLWGACAGAIARDFLCKREMQQVQAKYEAKVQDLEFWKGDSLRYLESWRAALDRCQTPRGDLAIVVNPFTGQLDMVKK